MLGATSTYVMGRHETRENIHKFPRKKHCHEFFHHNHQHDHSTDKRYRASGTGLAYLAIRRFFKSIVSNDPTTARIREMNGYGKVWINGCSVNVIYDAIIYIP